MRIAITATLAVLPLALAAQPAPLTVETIMQDPDTWVGAWPSDHVWSEDGQTLYFRWNPQGQFPADSLFRVTLGGPLEPEQVPPDERRRPRPTFSGWHHGEGVYDEHYTRKAFTDDGDLFVYDRMTGATTRLTQTRERASNVRFTPDGTALVFARGDNAYRIDLATGLTRQLTDLRSGEAPSEKEPDAQGAFLREQQQALFEVLRERTAEQEAREAAQEREASATGEPPTVYLGGRNVRSIQVDPTERYAAVLTYQSADGDRGTAVQDYVTESGYAENLDARPKVGGPQGAAELLVVDLARDTSYTADLHALPGAYDVPPYRREAGAEADSSESKRMLGVAQALWRPDGAVLAVEVRAADNKDRWIALFDPAADTLMVLDRQHDPAWVAGPGIGWRFGGGPLGWMADGRTLYFQSEATGYSHLYAADTETGAVQPLTDGDFEVFDPMLSQDGQTWFFTSSEGSPFERHLYRMPAGGGPRTRLTTLPGRNDVALNPDEETLGLLRSTSNHPPEVYVQAAGEAPTQVTDSPTEAWAAYDWSPGELVSFEASDGVEVPAQLFRPENPNGAAVLFVHGAGYLQNVHRWWSSYFREYMFHNLLAQRGYTVLNVDYRGSAGYGRDWRTAIYRHMGGRDLQDYVDASRWLGEAYGIDPERVFIYGGSYGGFITLMALFTEPEHFGGGAALRSVTDWAHYNHGYTANILNTPAQDSLAFARSSPIYFAEGLEDPLLIAHGMVDTNVQFQDVVRLAQRLIELGKEDWELAVYPIEGHGFTEPSSWTDEYRRILELVEASVGPARAVEAIPVGAGGR